MNELRDLADLMSSSRVSRTRLPDQTGVVLDIVGLHVMSLNETGQFVVEQLARGLADEDEMVRRMVAEFRVDELTARRDLGVFVVRLRELLPRRP
ncbi:MAG: PqqD family protein [Thermoanaerobaculaceae bacterium]